MSNEEMKMSEAELEKEFEKRVNAPDVTCDACGDDDCSDWYISTCTGCKKIICESCEEQHCDDGYHSCPLCHTEMGKCSPA